MEWKKLGKTSLFPPVAVIIVLVPISTALLVYSMVVLGVENILSYISYVLSFYTLVVWCVRIPDIVKFLSKLKRENKYVKIWLGDERLRLNTSLAVSVVWNSLYGAFQIYLGVYHATFWFTSFGIYYICLSLIRLRLMLHTRKYKPGEQMRRESVMYVITGWVFLFLNLMLTVIIFFMIYFNRTFEHHMIVAIAMAAYTFTSVTVAIIGTVKYRKYKSPIYSATKAIGLASALVSILTLESTLLTAFADGSLSPIEEKLMLGATGAGISIVIVAMAVYMIAFGAKKYNNSNSEVENGQQ